MNASNAQILQELETGRLALLNAVESVPAELRSKRPGADRWSVAEVLEHLSLVERRSNVLLKSVIRNLRSSPAADVAAPPTTADGAKFSKSALLDRSRKVATVEAVRPTGNLPVDSALEALEASRAELKAIIASSDQQVMTSHAVNHHVFGALNVEQWIEFLAGHEARHTAQILEIAEQLNEN